VALETNRRYSARNSGRDAPGMGMPECLRQIGAQTRPLTRSGPEWRPALKKHSIIYLLFNVIDLLIDIIDLKY